MKPERAMWGYNRVFMSLGLRLQNALERQVGLIDDPDIDASLLVYRKHTE